MADLPIGIVTFLFTDIEGSTSLWEQDPQGMRASLEVHNSILSKIITANAGMVFKIVGDSFQAVFEYPSQAIETALDVQKGLSTADWGTTGPLRVRMGLHSGPADVQGNDYVVSHTLNRVSRVMSVGYGGQILLTNAVAELVGDKVPEDASLRDMGEHFLKGLTKSEHLFQVMSSDLPGEFPPLHTQDLPPHNLPFPMTSFIGREREIKDIRKILSESRLVTLIGSGGVGKSRLAIEVGHQVLNEYSNGVWLVELAPLSDSSLLPQVTAGSLGVRETKSRPLINSLTDFLHNKRCLLILDNCEHLLEACASLANHLLLGCPELAILASSREALGLGGERLFQVPSLTLPVDKPVSAETLTQFDAINLFVERSQASLPGFRLNEENTPALAQICQQLDGIPHAIELAAARVKVLRVEQIANRLDDRFQLLTGGSRSALPHQKTLQATIDWSYDLLLDKERALLQKLSVFSGGWDLEAAEAVCEGDDIESYNVMDLLDSLVNKSIVLVERIPGKETRYRLLKTVRHYAHEKYVERGRTELTRQRHCEYYSSLVKQAHRERYGEGAKYGEEKWLDRIELEHDNIRGALDWIIGVQDAESGSQIVEALDWFWTKHAHYYEARDWTQELLNICSQGSRAYAIILMTIGNQNFVIGKYEEGRAYLEESIILFQELGETREIEKAVQSLGWIAAAQGKYVESRQLLGKSLKMAQELEDNYRIAWAYLSLGELARAEKNLELAYQYHTRSLALFREQNAKSGISIELSNLAFVVLHHGNDEHASEMFVESLLISLKLGDKAHQSVVLGGLASVAQRKGQAERAACLFGASASIHISLGRAIDPGDVADFKDFQAATRASMSEQAFTTAWAEGQSMTLGQAVAYALGDI
jgi:predicted ATPase/class 3 adenylate cyclase